MASPANLVTQFLSTLLYGIFLVIFFQCLVVMCRRDHHTGRRFTRPASRTMLVVAILLALVATMDSITHFFNNVQSYELSKGMSKASRRKSARAIEYVTAIDIVLATTLADGILIYRVWIVYNRNWRSIALPLVLGVLGLLSAILVMCYQSKLPVHSNSVSPLRELIATCWISTILLNVISTSLIIYRIHRMTPTSPPTIASASSKSGPTLRGLNGSEQDRKAQYNRTMRIIIESGLLYTVVATVNGIVWIIGDKAQWIRGTMGAVDVQIIGIAFGLLTIRVYSERTAASQPRQQGRSDTGGSSAVTTGGPRFRTVTLTATSFGAGDDIDSVSEYSVRSGQRYEQDDEEKRLDTL